MNRTFRLIILLALTAVSLAAPAVAHADGAAVRRDCLEDGKLDRQWPREDLVDAIRNAPSNEEEYGGDCRDLIRAELSAQVAGREGGPAGAGARAGGVGGVEGDSSADGIPDTDEDFEALQTAIGGGRGDDDSSGGGGAPALALGDRTIVPEAPPAALVRASNELPAPVWLALVALLALVSTAGMIAARRRFPQVRRAAFGLLRR